MNDLHLHILNCQRIFIAGPGVSYQTFAREAKNFSVLGEGMDEAMRQYCYHCVAKKPT